MSGNELGLFSFSSRLTTFCLSTFLSLIKQILFTGDDGGKTVDEIRHFSEALSLSSHFPLSF